MDEYSQRDPDGCSCNANGKGGGPSCITILLFIVAFMIYYLSTHPLPDFRKWHDYFSNILGTRKLRFIPRSELDVPKITPITEEMDINPYSFFPSKDLM